jgi:hypothetical protein
VPSAFRASLLAMLHGRVMKNVQQAEQFAAPVDRHRARARLGQAAHGLKNFVRRLNSSRGRKRSRKRAGTHWTRRRERSQGHRRPRRVALMATRRAAERPVPARERTEDVRELVERLRRSGRAGTSPTRSSTGLGSSRSRSRPLA